MGPYDKRCLWNEIGYRNRYRATRKSEMTAPCFSEQLVLY